MYCGRYFHTEVSECATNLAFTLGFEAETEYKALFDTGRTHITKIATTDENGVLSVSDLPLGLFVEGGSNILVAFRKTSETENFKPTINTVEYVGLNLIPIHCTDTTTNIP